MSNKLFVGSLSWGTNDDGLRHHFGQYGALEDVKVITDRETGRSRGFGFVTVSKTHYVHFCIQFKLILQLEPQLTNK